MTKPSHLVSSGTLVLVDMQPAGFPLSRVALPGVKREILQAIELGWPIVLVEFDLECCKNTDAEIMAILDESKYSAWRVVTKTVEDGSPAVIASCSENGFPQNLFRVAGVMTDVCVAATAIGLVRLVNNCQVEVIKDACATWSGRRYDWNTFPKDPRLALVDA